MFYGPWNFESFSMLNWRFFAIAILNTTTRAYSQIALFDVLKSEIFPSQRIRGYEYSKS